jgi:uncharacterized protein (DUF433 family)
MTELSDRITGDPDVMGGKAVIRGTRLTVEFVLGLLADGWTIEQILEGYPFIAREDVVACLNFAREVVGEQVVISSAA